MKLTIGIVLLIALGFVLLRMRRSAGPQMADSSKSTGGATRSNSNFHAVSIKPGVRACSAVRALAGQRLLSVDVPQIPLPDCDQSECTCRFMHHHDRRVGDDRRSPYPPSVGLDVGSIGADRREESDRRKR